MEEDTKFPSWILTVEKSYGHNLNNASRDFFKKALECYPHFHSTYANCPKTSELGFLTTHELGVLKDHFEKSTLPQFIIANISETFHFQLTYQIRELSLAMHDSLERGSFYTAAILQRSIFESVCTYYYTFRRADEKHKQSIRLLQAITKTKSKLEKNKLTRQYYECLYEIYSLVIRGNTATSLDWAEYLKKFGIAGGQPLERAKRIHINDAIKDIAKISKLPLMEAYDLMSEFVHPNYGSKTLVVRTMRPHHKFMDVLVLGDNSDNPEAAIFYLNHFAENLFYTLTLACSLHERSVQFLDVIFSLIAAGKIQIAH